MVTKLEAMDSFEDVESDSENLNQVTLSKSNKRSTGGFVSQEQFVQLMKDYPVLYDEDHPNYQERRAIKDAREELASQAGLSVDACRKRIKTILNRKSPNDRFWIVLLSGKKKNSKGGKNDPKTRKRSTHKFLLGPKPKGILKTTQSSSSSSSSSTAGRLGKQPKKVEFQDIPLQEYEDENVWSNEEFHEFMNTRIDKLSADERIKFKSFLVAMTKEYFTKLFE